MTERERTVLSAVIADLTTPDAPQLERQLNAARVIGGVPTFLELDVSSTADRARFPDGPLPVRSIVHSVTGEPTGEILVWMTQGYLSGLEYAWHTDETPTELPVPESVKILPQ